MQVKVEMSGGAFSQPCPVFTASASSTNPRKLRVEEHIFFFLLPTKIVKFTSQELADEFNNST